MIQIYIFGSSFILSLFGFFSRENLQFRTIVMNETLPCEDDLSF